MKPPVERESSLCQSMPCCFRAWQADLDPGCYGVIVHEEYCYHQSLSLWHAHHTQIEHTPSEQPLPAFAAAARCSSSAALYICCYCLIMAMCPAAHKQTAVRFAACICSLMHTIPASLALHLPVCQTDSQVCFDISAQHGRTMLLLQQGQPFCVRTAAIVNVQTCSKSPLK